MKQEQQNQRKSQLREGSTGPEMDPWPYPQGFSRLLWAQWSLDESQEKVPTPLPP